MADAHAGELFTTGRAELYLVDGSQSALMQSGQFSLMLVKNPISQLAAVVAMVGEVQWPVGRDSSVVRKQGGSFTFMLPGPLRYDLVLASPGADLQKLEHILEEYSDCQRPAEMQEQQHIDSAMPAEQPQPGGPSNESSRKRGALDIANPEMKGRMLRARRMSAVAKVFTKSLERGAINVSNHVEPSDTAAPMQQISSNLALASVNAVVKVVDAVETGGRTILLESAGSATVGVSPEAHRQGQTHVSVSSDSTRSTLMNSGWTLNRLGLLMIFRVISASMAVHSSGSSSSGSSRSGSSSSSNFRRLLSSSSSSSSLSSRSPATPQSHLQGGGSADLTSSALSLQSPSMGTATMPSPLPDPPPPPLFSQTTPRVRHSHMPPPSGPPPHITCPSAQIGTAFSDPLGTTPLRIYRPRPTPAAAVTGGPPLPSLLPRPPRFQPPPNS
ncbi:hypothetical protein L7F22_034770 [Adiantum nelumboides]|nr:hypothetical protein [Adiantum nelumboides]